MKKENDMLRVIIADDHPVVRAGLKQVLAESADILVAGEADNGEALLRKIQRQLYDVVLLDITMPGMDGLELCRRIRAHVGGPYRYVVMLTSRSERSDRLEALDAGAGEEDPDDEEDDRDENALDGVFPGGPDDGAHVQAHEDGEHGLAVVLGEHVGEEPVLGEHAPAQGKHARRA